MATKYWSGAVNTAWATAGNWTPSAPTTGDDVVVRADEYVRQIQSGPSSPITLASLTISYGYEARFTGGAKITVTGNMTVTGSGTTFADGGSQFEVQGTFEVNTGGYVNCIGTMTAAALLADASLVDHDGLTVTGSCVFQNGSGFAQGTLTKDGGTIVFDGSTFSGGSFAGSCNVTVTNGSTLSGGSFENTGSVSISADSTVTFLACAGPSLATVNGNHTIAGFGANTPVLFTGTTTITNQDNDFILDGTTIRASGALTLTRTSTANLWTVDNGGGFSLDNSTASLKYYSTCDKSIGVAPVSITENAFTDPGEANVWTGTSYKVNAATKNGSKVASSITNCSAGNIKSGVTIGDVAGTDKGEDFNSDPGVANVKTGTAWKYLSAANNRTGTMAPSAPGVNQNPLVTCG